MKIAFCISGFLRIWKDTKKSFLEQLLHSPHEYDLFIHTYNQNYYEFTSEKKDEFLSEEEVKTLFSDCPVKKIVIENRDEILPISWKEADKYNYISNYNLPQEESGDVNTKKIPIGVRLYDHLRKLHLCNELRKEYEKETGIKYDLVVKTRFDLVYFNKPNWESCLDGKVHFEYGATFGWPNDTFCACQPYLMDNFYANRFTMFDEIFLPVKNGQEEKIGMCAHGTLKYALEKGNVEIGHPVVNTNCFRNTGSFQYHTNYRKKYDLNSLYEQLSNCGEENPYLIENIKRGILGAD